MNTKGLIGIIILTLFCMPSSFAKSCGNSHISNSKTCHVGGGSSSSGGYSSYESFAPSTVTYGAYGRQETNGATAYSGTIVRKAGIRTCPVSACTVVGYYQTGNKVTWSAVNNGFVNITDTVNWVKLSDIRRDK